jgi:hypothetical protein
MKKVAKKRMTIDKLATEMRAGFSGVNKRIDTTVDLIDRLAVSTAKGFEHTATKDDLKELRVEIKGDIEGVKDQLSGTNRRIDHLAETKVSKVTYKELDSRVGVVERKLAVKK